MSLNDEQLVPVAGPYATLVEPQGVVEGSGSKIQSGEGATAARVIIMNEMGGKYGANSHRRIG